ncbi:MAG: hypothetical protein ACRCXX_05915 [Cetobacterium sp.]|uniref:hypothetical protein n=1 Tax=Cetobacterium sp. TaxID=2071632 RepID=UPI003F38D5F7
MLDTLNEKELIKCSAEDLKHIADLKAYSSILRMPGNCIISFLEKNARESVIFRNTLEKDLINTIVRNALNYRKYDDSYGEELVNNMARHYNKLAICGFDIMCLIRDIVLSDYHGTLNVPYFRNNINSINTDIVESPKVKCGGDHNVIVLFSGSDRHSGLTEITDTYIRLLTVHRYLEKLCMKFENICGDKEIVDTMKVLISNFREAITFEKILDIDYCKFKDRDSEILSKYNSDVLDDNIKRYGTETVPGYDLEG